MVYGKSPPSSPVTSAPLVVMLPVPGWVGAITAGVSGAGGAGGCSLPFFVDLPKLESGTVFGSGLAAVGLTGATGSVIFGISIFFGGATGVSIGWEDVTAVFGIWVKRMLTILAVCGGEACNAAQIAAAVMAPWSNRESATADPA